LSIYPQLGSTHNSDTHNVAKELAMAGALRKTMVYLGLAEDEHYDGYDDYDEPDAGHETS
jgi:hypothetical protein